MRELPRKGRQKLFLLPGHQAGARPLKSQVGHWTQVPYQHRKDSKQVQKTGPDGLGIPSLFSSLSEAQRNLALAFDQGVG